MIGDPGAPIPCGDVEALQRLRRFGGEKLLGELVQLFLAATPERLAGARQALAAGDVETVRLATHSLKSSAGQLGARAMQGLAEHAERLARSGARDDLLPILLELEAEFERVRGWLADVQRRERGEA